MTIKRGVLLGLTGISSTFFIVLVVAWLASLDSVLPATWNVSQNRIVSIAFSDQRISIAVMDTHTPALRFFKSDMILLAARWHHGDRGRTLAGLLGFDYLDVAFTPPPANQWDWWNAGLSRLRVVSLPDWLFILLTAALPAAIAWRALDQRSLAARDSILVTVGTAADLHVDDLPLAELAPAGPATIDYFTSQSHRVAGNQAAGYLWRLVAWLIDWLVILAVVFAAAAPFNFVRHSDLVSEQVEALAPWLFFTLVWLNCAMFESSALQATPGKRLLGLCVVDTEGRRITFSRATFRVLVKTFANLPFFLGYLLAPLNAQRQAVHDLAAGTAVKQRARRLA